jgi:hypothetical protein
MERSIPSIRKSFAGCGVKDGKFMEVGSAKDIEKFIGADA